MNNMAEIISMVDGVKSEPQDMGDVERQQQRGFRQKTLLVRWELASRARNWPQAMAIAKAIITALPSEPIGWIYHGFAEQQMGQVSEARQTLLAAARKFPDDWRIAYNLACYAAQLGDTAGAWNWFDRALEIGDAATIQRCAMEEPSLRPLWKKRERKSVEDALEGR